MIDEKGTLCPVTFARAFPMQPADDESWRAHAGLRPDDRDLAGAPHGQGCHSSKFVVSFTENLAGIASQGLLPSELSCFYRRLMDAMRIMKRRRRQRFETRETR